MTDRGKLFQTWACCYQEDHIYFLYASHMIQASRMSTQEDTDWGGKGGAIRVYQKWFWRDSIFSCDRRRSRRMRSFLRSSLVYFFFLDLASCNLQS